MEWNGEMVEQWNGGTVEYAEKEHRTCKKPGDDPQIAVRRFLIGEPHPCITKR